MRFPRCLVSTGRSGALQVGHLGTPYHARA
nr:MAG TPA: hypothetical protein [Caudoviricetes sp.]